MKIGQPMDSRAITWDKSFAGKYSDRFDKAQKFIDAECIRHMVKYTPTLSTNLRKSATRGTKIGSGKIQYLAPYARYQYYGKLMVSSVTGSAYARQGEKKVLTDKDLVYSTFRKYRRFATISISTLPTIRQQITACPQQATAL